MYKVDK